MSISKLHLFSKNTDASSSMRGYQYQVLKTLETWLVNYINSIDEVIYCDFEEDIFQRNDLTQTVRFRQLKLYSSNFSFSSEEIKKALSHFFMLHVKTDYREKEKEFVFEANSQVAEHRKGNEADLLREWVMHQESLPTTLLEQCARRVSIIVTKYVQERTIELTGKVDGQTIDEALVIFGQLTEQDWIDFTRSIKWRFEGVGANTEFSNTIANIEQLIKALPFELTRPREEALFGLFYTRVSITSSNQAPEERKLTVEQLTGIILNSGTEEDRWYTEVHTKWQEAGIPTQFRIGEFYEVLKAVRYCRWSQNLTAHDAFWLGMLDDYLGLSIDYPTLRKQALYEQIFLRLRPTEYLAPPQGDLFGCEDHIREYLAGTCEFTTASEFEDSLPLLFTALASVLLHRSNLTVAETQQWLQDFGEGLQKTLAVTTRPTDVCRLLECSSNLEYFANSKAFDAAGVEKILAPLENLLGYLDQAALYDATQLSRRVHTHIRLLTQNDPEENELLIEAYEDYVKRLDNRVVHQRRNDFQTGKEKVQLGSDYLGNPKPELLLRALEQFHKTKDLWLQQETIRGYVLALLNIAQVYNAAGMNLAAKYYALGATWISIGNGDQALVPYIARGYGLAFHADFSQGAWASASKDFEEYVRARHEFDAKPFGEDELGQRIMFEYGMLLYAAPLLSPELRVMVDSKVAAAGYVGEDHLAPLIKLLQTELPEARLRDALRRNSTDSPLNDLGTTRNIRFNALGLSWAVSFPNTFQFTSVAEEFCALLQILLVEIALAKVDFHLPRGTVDIVLRLSDRYQRPVQRPDNSRYAWEVFLQEVESVKPEEITLGVASVTAALQTVLDEISLLPALEFEAAFLGLFEKSGLATKTLAVNSYQRIYRALYQSSASESALWQHFQPGPRLPGLPEENLVMKWKASLSKKYNQQDALRHIQERYKGSYRCIHLTLGKLKQDPGFLGWLQNLRQQGWLDWQVILAMMNFVLDYKAHLQIKTKDYASEQEYVVALQKLMPELMEQDEREFEVEFPLEAFTTRQFQQQLAHSAVYVLRSFGLENKSRLPNFEAAKDFLRVRFNVGLDSTNEDNPLHEYPRLTPLT